MSAPSEIQRLGLVEQAPTILLVEDDANDAELVQASLQEAARNGARIIRAATLAEGLQALQQHDVQLTVLDLDLPDSAGFDTLEKMRAATHGPVIVVSGNPHPALVAEALKRRAYEVLHKTELDAAMLARIVRLAGLQSRTEQSLRLTQRRYEALLEGSREAVVLLGPAGELLYGNPALQRLLWQGGTRAGANLLDVVHPYEREAVRAEYARLAAAPQGRSVVKAHLRHHDGSWRMLEATLHNRLDDAGVAAVVANIADVAAQAGLEERFRATFDQAAVGIAHIGEDGRFQLVNRKLCDILGYSREELSARTVFEVSHPQDREVTPALRRRMRARDFDSFSASKRYLRKDGSTVWVEVAVSLVRSSDGAPSYEIAVFEDISARRQAEEALQRSERRFRALIENSSDGILLADAQACLVYASPGARRTLGYGQGETLGWELAELVHSDDRAHFDRVLASAQQRPGVTHELEVRIRQTSGAHRLLAGTCTDLRNDETVRSIVFNLRDITEREQAEARARRLARMYAALSAANEAAAQLPAEKELFQKICEIAVEHGDMALATVRILARGSSWLDIAGHAGGMTQYLPTSRISTDPALPEGQGIAAEALRTGRTTVSNDFLAEPKLRPWWEAAREAGIGAVACIPLRRAETAIGLLILYSRGTGWFDAELVTLAERMAASLSQALDRFDGETQRRDAEERLRDSEARFRSLANLSSDWYWEQDAELRFSWHSPNAASRLGVALHERLGLRRWDIAGAVPLSGTWEDHEATLRARQPFRNFEYMRTGTHGTTYVSISGEPMFDAQGRFTGYRGTAQDITARKQAELHMSRLKSMYAALGAANEAILRAESAAELLRGACEIAVQAGGFVLGSVFLLDPATRMLSRAAASGAAAAAGDDLTPSIDDTNPGGHGLIGLACRTGEAQICNDYQSDPRTRERRKHGRRYAVAAAAVFPLRVEGELAGVFGLQHAERDVFSEELTGLLQRLADNISFALENFGREARRLKAEHDLRESEERFRTVVDSANEGILVYDHEHHIVAANAAAERIIGAPAATLIGRMGFTSLFPCVNGDGTPLDPEDRPTRATVRGGVALTGRLVGIVRPDSSVTWVSVNTAFLRRHGEAAHYGLVSTINDVTAQRTAEQELRRFRAALNASADSIYLVDAEAMRIIDVNDAAAHGLGYEREELLGQSFGMLFADREGADLKAAFRQLVAGQGPARMQRASHRRKDGSLVPVEITRRVLRSGERTYLVGIARDISERLQAEERLQQSVERFEMVARATNDVVYDWNLVTDQLWCNENFRLVFGYQPHDVGAYVDTWTSRIHPEDVDFVKGDIRAAIEGGYKAWSGEYRFRRKDGSYAVVHDRGLVIHDSGGKPVRMIGAMVDISARKETERRIRLHAQRSGGMARLGQFALGAADLDQVFAEATRVLRSGGADAVAVFELQQPSGHYLVRAAEGDGAESSVGLSAPPAADSIWSNQADKLEVMRLDRGYLESRPSDRPWSWIRRMGSAAYVPLRGETHLFGVLGIYALADQAFSDDDLRFGEAVANVLSATLRRHQAQTRLAYMAEFDALTGLPNRNLLQDRLTQTVAQTRRHGWQGAVLFIDLDRFKLVNDTLGHHVGDALLAEAGKRLKQCVRSGDTVGRVSGDEFGVVLSELAAADDAALVAQKILDALALPFDLDGNEAYITASIGISVFPADGEDAETLLKNADMAMYRAKEMTRNAYCFFTLEMNQRSAAKLQLNTDLRHAIERRELVLHYQPKVDLRDGRVLGVEALLRWNHPQRGMVSPAEFIPALEDSGLILPVGEWVLEEACTQLRRWQLEGLEAVPVAVNLSAKQFHRRDMDAAVRRALALAGISSGLIELEVTESCLMSDPEEAVRLLGSLRAAGLKISIDDFGTGYSSLSYLTRLPLNSLKIDKSFVQQAASTSESASIVRAIIDMAHNLHFTVIAEGVETEDQVAFLRRHGCDLGQGYLFDRPMPANELSLRLRRLA
jgi:diguanylate cyclase (GGDEF)-like protein/PAS domain S-box-containing protein